MATGAPAPRVAVKYGAISQEPLVGADGTVSGAGAGPILVRRLLALFPDPVLIGPRVRRGAGFDEMPLDFVEPATTLVINLDVVDSPVVWQVLRRDAPEPRVMNFLWRNVADYPSRVEQASLGLSFGLFPTFANSERTAGEIRSVLAEWAVTALAERAVIGWANLGIRWERVRPRREPRVPVVLYPAVTLDRRKRSDLFLRVVERVAARNPLRLEMRLQERDLVSAEAMRISRLPWSWVGPLTSREDYWERLAQTTAFLATSSDESYGLQYLEALAAGAVGIFPDLPWARALLPLDYPFLYADEPQAEAQLSAAVADPEAARTRIAQTCGDLPAWLRARHSDDDFERAFADFVRRCYGGGVGGRT